jgi:hypothetical protein
VNVPRWLRGHASASPHSQTYVRLWMERPGLTTEIYLTRKQARELRNRLDEVMVAQERARKRTGNRV